MQIKELRRIINMTHMMANVYTERKNEWVKIIQALNEYAKLLESKHD